MKHWQRIAVRASWTVFRPTLRSDTRTFCCMPRFREAEEEYRRVFAEHPKMTPIRGGVAFALWAQRRFREAVSEFEILKAAYPAPNPGAERGETFLAAALSQPWNRRIKIKSTP
jgi:hypothetical protein